MQNKDKKTLNKLKAQVKKKLKKGRKYYDYQILQVLTDNQNSVEDTVYQLNEEISPVSRQQIQEVREAVGYGFDEQDIIQAIWDNWYDLTEAIKQLKPKKQAVSKAKVQPRMHGKSDFIQDEMIYRDNEDAFILSKNDVKEILPKVNEHFDKNEYTEYTFAQVHEQIYQQIESIDDLYIVEEYLIYDRKPVSHRDIMKVQDVIGKEFPKGQIKKFIWDRWNESKKAYDLNEAAAQLMAAGCSKTLPKEKRTIKKNVFVKFSKTIKNINGRFKKTFMRRLKKKIQEEFKQRYRQPEEPEPEVDNKQLMKQFRAMKKTINVVIVGHVDSGKSTLIGQLLTKLGMVSKKKLHNLEKKAKELKMESWKFAFLVDTDEQEQQNGKTIDVAVKHIEMEDQNIMFTILDCPGHSDFVPDMMDGAAEADAAILVIDSAGYKSGIQDVVGYENQGGQTIEHINILKSMGVQEIIVAVNKLDEKANIAKDQQSKKYTKIKKLIKSKFQQYHLKRNKKYVRFLPMSAYCGINIIKKAPQDYPWFKDPYNKKEAGPCLLDLMKNFSIKKRDIEAPLRFTISSIDLGTIQVENKFVKGVRLHGKIEQGFVQKGQKCIIMPIQQAIKVKAISFNGIVSEYLFAGQLIEMIVECPGIKGQSLLEKVNVGDVVCQQDSLVPVVQEIVADMVLFDLINPLLRGVDVYQMHIGKSKRNVKIKNMWEFDSSKPDNKGKKVRLIKKNGFRLIVELVIQHPVCAEIFKKSQEYEEFNPFDNENQQISQNLSRQIQQMRKIEESKEANNNGQQGQDKDISIEKVTDQNKQSIQQQPNDINLRLKQPKDEDEELEEDDKELLINRNQSMAIKLEQDDSVIEEQYDITILKIDKTKKSQSVFVPTKKQSKQLEKKKSKKKKLLPNNVLARFTLRGTRVGGCFARGKIKDLHYKNMKKKDKKRKKK